MLVKALRRATYSRPTSSGATKMSLARHQPYIKRALILHHYLVIVVQIDIGLVLKRTFIDDLSNSLTVFSVIGMHEMATCRLIPVVIILFLLLLLSLLRRLLHRSQDYRCWRANWIIEPIVILSTAFLLTLIKRGHRIGRFVGVCVEILVLVCLHRCIIWDGPQIVVFLLFLSGSHTMTPQVCYETALNTTHFRLISLNMLGCEITVLKDLRVQVPQNLGSFVYSVLHLLLSLNIDLQWRLRREERSRLWSYLQVTFLLLIR